MSMQGRGNLGGGKKSLTIDFVKKAFEIKQEWFDGSILSDLP